MAVKDFKNQSIKNKKAKINKQKKIQGIEQLKKNDLLWMTFILAVTLIFYFPTFKNNFVYWDDNIYIFNNPFIYSLGTKNLMNIFSSFFMANYHPLTMLSYTIEYSIAGTSPFLYHFTNVLLHLLNTALVFIFVRRLFLMLDQTTFKNPGLVIPVVSALLFGLHPLHVESVSWISERKDVLYTFFFLLASVKYLQYISTQKPVHYFSTIVLFLLSLLSKGMAVSFSVCIIAIDFVLKRDLLSRKVIVEKIPFLILSLFFGIIAIYAQKSADTIIENINLSIWDKISFASYALVQYFIKLFVPYKLVHFYPYPYMINEEFPRYYYYFSIILITGACIIIYLFRKSRIIIFGLLYFIINIFLVLRLIPIGDTIMADRYTYLSSIGIYIIIAFFLNYLLIKYLRFRKLIISIIVIYAFVLGYQTFQRTMVWRDSFSLWDDASKKYPDNSVIILNRGIAIERKGDLNGALREYSRSIKLDPNNDAAYTNLGNMKLAKGDRAGAIAEYSKAISINPRNEKAINNRGKVLIDIGKFNEALFEFNKAIELDPLYVNALHNRGVAKFYLRKYAEATDDFSRVIQLNPKHAVAYYLRGLCYIYQNNREQACANFQKAVDLNFKVALNDLNKYCQ